MNKNEVLALLRKHTPFDAGETSDLHKMTTFVEANADFWSRRNLAGHVTASAWIVSADYQHALLTHHRKLDRWLQLGGHIEDDLDLLAAATREAREESGLSSLEPLSVGIFDVDVHLIPARPDEPAHYHYDVRFAFIADRAETLIVSEESKNLKWMPLDQRSQWADEASLLRMTAKTPALAGA